jgi:hypothetical protein
MTVAWMVVYGVVLVAICVVNILFPRQMWGLFKAWRFKNPETVEPSDLVIWWYRVSSTLGIILIAGVGVVLFVEYREDTRCEKVLPEFERLHQSGGVEAVERRARDLGLEVKDQTMVVGYSRTGSVVITDDGKPFATIYATGSNAFCDT